MSEALQLAAELPPTLPPIDAWKSDPDELKTRTIPTDDRGFVKPDETIEMILSYFEDDYDWPVDWSREAPQILRPDDHHFYWMSSSYKKQLYPGKYASVPAKFRNLPTNRGIVPRQFHNVIHKYTNPSEVPGLDHMAHYLESFEVALQLFRGAERALLVHELIKRADEDQSFARHVKRYNEIFESYSQAAAKASNTRALEAIGESEVDVESFSSVVERLGSCALLNVANYTALYFETDRAAA